MLIFKDNGEGQVQLYTVSSTFYKPANFQNKKIQIKKKNKEMISLFWCLEITGSVFKESSLLLDIL